jgi:hypothetical protein
LLLRCSDDKRRRGRIVATRCLGLPSGIPTLRGRIPVRVNIRGVAVTNDIISEQTDTPLRACRYP